MTQLKFSFGNSNYDTPSIVSDNPTIFIVDYSEKALAVFGDTKSIKDKLSALGGRFNPKLTHEGEKKAGWIFPKSKREQLETLF